MERHTRTAGLARRPLALLMAGVIALAGMAVTTAPADANPTPPIEVTATMRGCPAQGSTPAHVYVWPEANAVEDDLDLQAVRIRYRLRGTTSWTNSADEGVFLRGLGALRFDDVDSTDAIEVQYDIHASGDSYYQSNNAGFIPLPDIPITIPSSVALASLGSGTADDPYRISTPQHLDDIGCLISSGTPHFVLENDLYMTDDGTPSGDPVPFLPLGGAERVTSASLDGRGHAIHGLVIDRPRNNNVGLFSDSVGLVVRDLRIVAPQVTGATRVGVLGGNVRAASISRLTIDDAAVRFTAIGDSTRFVGGVAGYVQRSYFSDVRWSADIRALPPVWPIDPNKRPQPDIELNRIGGFAGETEEEARIQRVHGTVEIALEGLRVTNVGGFAGEADVNSDFDDVTLDATITVKGSFLNLIAGAFGSEFDGGVTLRDATVRTDIVLEGLPGAGMRVQNVGGIAARAEHAAFRRVDVSGTLLVDATKADGGESLTRIGGFAGQVSPVSSRASTVTESRSAVDVTVRAGSTEVSDVGALYGRIGGAPTTTQDVLVAGSVVIERDSTNPQITQVGGLAGEFDDSGGRTIAHLSRVIWRGGLTIDGLSGDALLAASLPNTTAVGALLGTDRGTGGQRSHCVFWDVANGFTDPDTLMPGSPRTAAQLVALLDGDCGFTTGFVQDSGAPVAWCLDDDGEPAIAALTAECRTTTIVQQVAPTAPTAPSGLRFACFPLQAVPGDRITCFATGAVPNIDILWSASASPAFAGGPVTTNALGDLAFTFVVPSDMEGATIGVELVAWTAPVLIRIGDADGTPVGTDDGQGAPVGTNDGQGPPVPTGVPAGTGSPVGTVSTTLVLLALLGTILRLVGLDPFARIRAARTPQPSGGTLGAG
jgi:hypothetical protein